MALGRTWLVLLAALAAAALAAVPAVPATEEVWSADLGDELDMTHGASGPIAELWRRTRGSEKRPAQCPEPTPPSGRGRRSGSRPPQTSVDDFVTYPAAALPPLVAEHAPALVHARNLTFQGQKVFVFRIDNPLHHVFVGPPGGVSCPGNYTTSQTAKAMGCEVAINAGFFNRGTGDCVGNVITHGHRVQISGLENVNFGIMQNGSFLVGYIRQETVREADFAELVSGMLWIVREGKRWYCESYDIERPDHWFLDLIAPRTMIGHDAAGRVYLAVVEGSEPAHRGLTIYGMADLALHLGMVNAVNLDGGGSSTVVYRGRILNMLSDKCSNTGPVTYCERLVTTIICVR